jgi:hypothetical protein
MMISDRLNDNPGTHLLTAIGISYSNDRSRFRVFVLR